MDSLRLERLVHSGGCSFGVFRMVFRYFLAKGTMGITSVDNLMKPDVGVNVKFMIVIKTLVLKMEVKC